MGRTDGHHRDDGRADGRARSPRQGHLEARVRRALQMLLAKGLNDPRVRGLVSVTEVDLAPDQSHAIVRVSVLPAEAGPLTVAGLRHAAPRLASEVGAVVRSRRLPGLDFRLDERLKNQASFDAALSSAGPSTGADADEEGHDVDEGEATA